MLRSILLAVIAISISSAVTFAQSLTARDIAASVGLGGIYTTMGESPVFDFNGDGLLDLLPSTHGQEWVLRRQGPLGQFSPVLPGTFPRGEDRHGCIAADFNRDDRPDVYCVRGACKGVCSNPYPNRLYLQRPNGILESIPGAWEAADEHGRGRGVIAPDIDGDGDSDLIVVNEASDRFNAPNRVYINMGNRFVERVTPMTHELGTISAVAVRENTGALRVYMDTTLGLRVYRSTFGGEFTIMPVPSAGSGSIRDVDLADLSGDGLPDLVTVRKQDIRVSLNDGAYTFSRVNFTYPLREGRDVALCNMNADGRRDIYIVQGNNDQHDHILLINNGAGTNFSIMSSPQTSQGNGDIATCFRNWRNTGRDAVFVTNGKWGARGPYQLIFLE